MKSTLCRHHNFVPIDVRGGRQRMKGEISPARLRPRPPFPLPRVLMRTLNPHALLQNLGKFPPHPVAIQLVPLSVDLPQTSLTSHSPPAHLPASRSVAALESQGR